MLKKHGRSLERAFCFLDIFTGVLSLLIVSYWRFGSAFIHVLAHPVQYRIFFSVYMVCWLFLSGRFHLYGSRRTSGFMEEVWDVVKITSLCLAAASAPAFFIRAFPVSRVFLLYLWACQILLLISSRFILRKTLQYVRRRGYNYRNVLIIGRNARSAEMAKRIQTSPELGLRILGCIDSLNNERKRQK